MLFLAAALKHCLQSHGSELEFQVPGEERPWEMGVNQGQLNRKLSIAMKNCDDYIAWCRQYQLFHILTSL